MWQKHFFFKRIAFYAIWQRKINFWMQKKNNSPQMHISLFTQKFVYEWWSNKIDIFSIYPNQLQVVIEIYNVWEKLNKAPDRIRMFVTFHSYDIWPLLVCILLVMERTHNDKFINFLFIFLYSSINKSGTTLKNIFYTFS